METDFIPCRPEFLTKDWLMMVLNQYRSLKDQSLIRSPEDIKSIASAPHPLARGLLSSSYLVKVELSCMTSMGLEKIEYKLCIKMAVQEGEGRQVAIEAKTMEREVETLMGMMPRMRNMLKESDAQEVELAVPEMIYGAFNTSSDGVLVAFDSLALGWQRPSLGPGLSLPVLIATVEALARLHATSSVFVQKEKSLVSDFPHLKAAFYDCETARTAIASLLKDLRRLVRRVPGFQPQLAQVESWRERAGGMLAAARRRRPDPPLVCITHGSPGIENLLVKGDKVLLTDWKLSDLGSPLSDLAFLLFSSADQPTRLEQRQQLVETYHFAFCRALHRLGHDPATKWPNFNIDTVHVEFERCLFPAFLQAATTLMQQVQDAESVFKTKPSEEAGEHLRQVGRRLVELVDDATSSGFTCFNQPASSSSKSSCSVESCASLTLVLPTPKSTLF